MSFKRREKTDVKGQQSLAKGVRPSSANGAPVTSSGCASLDAVLSGHGGIPLGSGLLVEENGTTDFSSVLLRYFAAEGLLQGHDLWIGGGVGDRWVRDLPAATDAVLEEESSTKKLEDRMKIAWRYSNLGDFGSGVRSLPKSPAPSNAAPEDPYCHAYDLTKRQTSLPKGQITCSPPASGTGDPFAPILASLVETLARTTGVLRCVLPGLLTPAVYPPSASQSRYLVRFVNNLRAVLRTHPARLVLLLSLPLDLYPRSSAGTAWMEILLDGCLELIPLPNMAPAAGPTTTSNGGGADRDGPQGLLRIHKVPQLDRLGLEAADLAFKVTRKRFSIEAWSLPALAEEAPREGGGTLAQTKVDISF